MMYRWCCYWSCLKFTKTFATLVDLKCDDRDIIESCFVFSYLNNRKAGWRTTTFITPQTVPKDFPVKKTNLKTKGKVFACYQ